MTRCLVCNEVTEFKNVDQFRIKPMNMCICTSCGFVTYPTIIADMQKLKEYYREDYRNKKAPDTNNVYTGQRKLQLHAAFLAEFLEKWKDQEIVIGEIGSAFGMFLDWFRSCCPKAEINGTELTTMYRRVAKHAFKIDLKEDLDWSKKYDLLVSYKVAEHMIDVDKELIKYHSALKDDGKLYISIPNWFESMSNFGLGGFDIEYYYHKNHINVWMTEHFEHILAKAGFEIIKKNETFYDMTYMCIKSKNKEIPTFQSKYEFVMDALQRIHKAQRCYEVMDTEGAIKSWPNFPAAHVSHYENNRTKFHEMGYEWIVKNVSEKAIQDCPNKTEAVLLAANIAQRYDDFDGAIKYYNQVNKMKPNAYEALNGISVILSSMANKAENIEEKMKIYSENITLLRYLKDMNLQHRDNTMTWLLYNYAQIPLPSELKSEKAV